MVFRMQLVRCSLSFLIAAALGATTVPSLSFEELTDQSEAVVSGEVTRSWSDWDSDHRFIWTHHEIKVSGIQKGTAPANVVVSEPGGVVGNRAMGIAGAVSYVQGEQVTVFLQRMPNGYLRTTGWGQGKFDMDRTGHLHPDASLRGVEIIDLNQTKASSARTPLRSLDGISVSELRSRIGARIALQGGSAK
jgi:hypothetical protein